MFVKTQLKNIASYSKGVQINGDKLIDDGIYDYLNGGIVPSGKWNDFNTPGKTITISEGGNSCGYVNYMQKPFWCGAHCYYLFDTKINSEYLYYALKSQQDRLMGIRSGACMPNIKKTDLGMFEIKYDTDENKQEIVVKALRNVEFIINSRLKELHQLDQLIKARFVEMFGDPFCTTKWVVKELSDISESMLDGSNVNPDYYEIDGEVLFLRIQNVWRNGFILDDTVFISQEINNNYYYDTSLKFGDLLITKIGRYYTKDSSLGRVAVYRGKDNCANYSNNIMCVRLNDSVNSEFVNVLLNLDDYQSYIRRTSKGGTDKRALSKSLIGSYPIIIPPINLQNEFVTFVQQVNKSKFGEQKLIS